MKKSILDRSFHYVPSGNTNIRDTFRAAKHEPAAEPEQPFDFDGACKKFLDSPDARVIIDGDSNSLGRFPIDGAMRVAFLAGLSAGLGMARDIYNSAPKEKR